MIATAGDTTAAWSSAASVAALLAVDPAGTGVVLRGAPGAARERWLGLARECNPDSARWRRIPLHIADHRLLGGLDLAATLRAGRPVAERGLLVEANGSMVVLAMAERVEPATAARLAAVLDAREVVLERDGIALRTPTSFGLIALDEGAAEEEQVPRALLDRLAFRIELTQLRAADAVDAVFDAEQVACARASLRQVAADEAIIAALCAAAAALGIASLRAPSLALRVARAAAALGGHARVTAEDASLAAQLVLAPRATQLPAPPPEDQSEPPPQPAEPQPDDDRDPRASDPAEAQALEERVVEAARAAIPADLLARLKLAEHARASPTAGGRAGSWKLSRRRGRPAGTRRGEPRDGSRLNVIETLRVAAPWQPIRRRSHEQAPPGSRPQRRPRIEVRRDDFRITRYRERTQTTTIFAVDASGSTALHRLAEAKGAVELLLADCYVRRDQVALIAFRGHAAELLLPPTRSLVRAKRSLAALPGGGGTPLANGIEAAMLLAESVRRRGETAVIVLLTDGRGNLARDGRPGREPAERDAIAAARAVRIGGHSVLLVDTSPQPQPRAQRLATEMNARYLALPFADAGSLSAAVRLASPGAAAAPARAGRSRS